MGKDDHNTKLTDNNSVLPKPQKRLKDEKLAEALRANLRRRKFASSSLNDSDKDSSL